MVIPGYKLGREVQVRQACTTYNALDVEHSKTVVVKVFNEALSKDPAFQKHFRDITERLVDQPLANNVHYLDAIVTDDACVLVTNYCPPSPLQQDIYSKFSVEKVLDTGTRLAVSLSQLHGLGIVHGGVELSNIHFLDSGEVVLETVAPQRTVPGNDAPKLEPQNPQDATCLAPEANTGLTVSSDFFSLGVVLYELLLGRKPFDTDTMAEIEQQKKAGQYLPLAGELAHLEPLFSGLLSPDPNSRIASHEHFVSVLNECRMGSAESNYTTPAKPADTEPASVTTRPTAVDSEKPTGRHPLVFASVAAIVIAAVVGFSMVSGQQETPQQVVDEKQPPVPAEKPTSVVEAPRPAQQSQKQTEAGRFYSNARTLVQDGYYRAALQAIDRALEIEPDNEAAKNLRTEIEQELKIQSDVAAAEQQRILEAKRRVEQREQAEQERAARQRAAALAEQRRLERERIARAEQDERLAAQQREIAARDTEINQRFRTAEQQLTTRPLSWLALERAESEYRVLVRIANDDSRVPDLYQKILDSHLALAIRQKSDAQLTESMDTIDRGLALNEGNQELLALRNEIAIAIQKSEEEENKVPVIGTF